MRKRAAGGRYGTAGADVLSGGSSGARALKSFTENNFTKLVRCIAVRLSPVSRPLRDLTKRADLASCFQLDISHRGGGLSS